MAGALTGGFVMFATWLVAVLLQMPRPPVPPSLGASLLASVLAGIGFGLGAVLIGGLIGCRRGSTLGAILWPLACAVLGTLVMFPFGGMLVGFSLFGLGMASVASREVHLWRTQRAAPAPRDA